MKSKLFLFLAVIISFFSCADDDPEPADKSTTTLNYRIDGLPEVVLENVSGTSFGSNYEAGLRESARVFATNGSNDIVVEINLIDNNNSIKAIQAGGSLPINPTMSTEVYASLSISENGTTYEAISGTVSISFYDLIPNSNPDKISVSGSFTVSDGTTSASGAFSDIELNCTECGG